MWPGAVNNFDLVEMTTEDGKMKMQKAIQSEPTQEDLNSHERRNAQMKESFADWTYMELRKNIMDNL